jgi:hypothetical protein
MGYVVFGHVVGFEVQGRSGERVRTQNMKKRRRVTPSVHKVGRDRSATGGPVLLSDQDRSPSVPVRSCGLCKKEATGPGPGLP